MRMWIVAATAAVALSVGSLVIAQGPPLVIPPGPGQIFNNTVKACMAIRAQICNTFGEVCVPVNLCSTGNCMQQARCACFDDCIDPCGPNQNCTFNSP